MSKFSLKGKTGFTLIELLCAVFILSVGIAGVLLFFSNSMLSSGYAWDMTVGTSHAEYLLEEMQTKETLADITRTDWPNWAQQQGLATLPQESFQVVYLNAVQDPLEIEVQVNWVRKGRNSNVVLKTKMTKQP